MMPTAQCIAWPEEYVHDPDKVESSQLRSHHYAPSPSSPSTRLLNHYKSLSTPLCTNGLVMPNASESSADEHIDIDNVGSSDDEDGSAGPMSFADQPGRRLNNSQQPATNEALLMGYRESQLQLRAQESELEELRAKTRVLEKNVRRRQSARSNEPPPDLQMYTTDIRNAAVTFALTVRPWVAPKTMSFTARPPVLDTNDSATRYPDTADKAILEQALLEVRAAELYDVFPPSLVEHVSNQWVQKQFREQVGLAKSHLIVAVKHNRLGIYEGLTGLPTTIKGFDDFTAIRRDPACQKWADADKMEPRILFRGDKVYDPGYLFRNEAIWRTMRVLVYGKGALAPGHKLKSNTNGERRGLTKPTFGLIAFACVLTRFFISGDSIFEPEGHESRIDYQAYFDYLMQVLVDMQDRPRIKSTIEWLTRHTFGSGKESGNTASTGQEGPPPRMLNDPSAWDRLDDPFTDDEGSDGNISAPVEVPNAVILSSATMPSASSDLPNNGRMCDRYPVELYSVPSGFGLSNAESFLSGDSVDHDPLSGAFPPPPGIQHRSISQPSSAQCVAHPVLAARPVPPPSPAILLAAPIPHDVPDGHAEPPNAASSHPSQVAPSSLLMPPPSQRRSVSQPSSARRVVSPVTAAHLAAAMIPAARHTGMPPLQQVVLYSEGPGQLPTSVQCAVSSEVPASLGPGHAGVQGNLASLDDLEYGSAYSDAALANELHPVALGLRDLSLDDIAPMVQASASHEDSYITSQRPLQGSSVPRALPGAPTPIATTGMGLVMEDCSGDAVEGEPMRGRRKSRGRPRGKAALAAEPQVRVDSTETLADAPDIGRNRRTTRATRSSKSLNQ
ncbi:hypothetical protein BN946_scf184994.g64 [Trametes cinnabarina]|uniref:Uncharacterized protein n=1 Tax=Pycnoporus cinnabarinus TaxID=5643 RepID=A0A060SF57_PYCCI|nr:hypothetical protein BN946_scf184994.g64 [Trametes cinnabarina]